MHESSNAVRRQIFAAGLLGAVSALKQSLQKLGSDLLILQGPMESVLPELLRTTQASHLVLEEEVEYR